MGKRTKVYFLDENNRDFVLEKVSASLNRGDICVIPTDTIYGIVAADCFTESVSRIYKIKKRPEDKPFIRLIGSLDNLPYYTAQLLPKKLMEYWPGSLTVIFLGLREKTVSIRFPDDPFLKRLFRMLDYKALFAPSANISGEENIYDNDRLIETFSGKVSAIVCLKKGLQKKRASTIVDISTGQVKLIREGDLKLDL
jgi:L-threonylcarbamoyladenylate synthase